MLQLLTDEELLAQSDQDALMLLFWVLLVILVTSVICAGALLIKSIRAYGSKGVVLNTASFVSASVSFFVAIMGVTLIVMYSHILIDSLPGLSILLGLMGLETVGILRLIALWETRAAI